MQQVMSAGLAELSAELRSPEGAAMHGCILGFQVAARQGRLAGLQTGFCPNRRRIHTRDYSVGYSKLDTLPLWSILSSNMAIRFFFF